MSFEGLPRSIHLSVTAAVGPRLAGFGPALRSAVTSARARGPVVLPPEVAALASLPADAVTPDLVGGLAAGLGLTGGAPAMAVVNTVLDAVPPRTRERLLVEFLSLLQTPSQ
jgi:hypothetical protein